VTLNLYEVELDGSKCKPVDGKPSLKGAWLGYVNTWNI